MTRLLLSCITLLLLLTSCGSRSTDYAALLAQAEEMNRNDIPFTSDSVGLALVRHYDHWWHSPDLRMRAYYMLGCANRDMGNAPRALENYQRAAEQTDTTSASRETLDRLMRIHSQMSELYLRQRLPELEEKELHIAERLAWRTEDTLSALIFREGVCQSLYNKKEYRLCIEETQSLYQQYLQYGYKENGLLAIALCIKSYLELNEYNKAKKYLDLYETCPLFQKSSEKVKGRTGALYILKGQYFLLTEKTDSASYYYRAALPYLQHGSNKLLFYKGMWQIFAISNDVDSVVKYTQLYSEAKEEGFDKGIAEATLTTQRLNDYNIEQHIARKKTEEASRAYRLLLLSIIATFIITGCSLYFQKKKKERIALLFQKYQLALQEYSETKEEIDILKHERASYKNLIAEYNQRMRGQEENISALENAIRKAETRAQGQNLKDSPIVKRLNLLRLQGRDKEVTDGDWRLLRKTVEETYPTFYGHMNARQPLNHSEYTVCLLVISGFEPTDIEILMNKSNSFSAVTRRRLCQKVFGIEGKPSDFDRLLHRLY